LPEHAVNYFRWGTKRIMIYNGYKIKVYIFLLPCNSSLSSFEYTLSIKIYNC
jgi:hypothetical protein